MADMRSIPGTPEWIKSKGCSDSSKPVTSVVIKEEGKNTPIEIKTENN